MSQFERISLFVQAEAALDRFGLGVLDAFDAIHRVSRDARILSIRRLALTTITFVASLECPENEKIPSAVLQALRSEPGSFFVAKGDATLASGPAHTVMLRDVTTAATTQVFGSGRVQIAGCASHIEFAAIMEELMDRLGELMGCRLTVGSFDTHLVNLNVGIGRRIVTSPELVDALNKAMTPLQANRRAEKRENYAAVTIVLPSARDPERASITSQVFASGNLQISGRVAADISIAFRHIIGFLETHSWFVVPMTARDTSNDDAKNVHCWHEFVSTLAPGLMHCHPPVHGVVEGCEFCARFGNFFL